MTTTSNGRRHRAHRQPPRRLAGGRVARRAGRRRRPRRSRCSRLRITSTAKSTPVAAAIARTSSCTGLPTVTPQVARGSPMRRASCSASTVSRPARPGRDQLRAAAEAGEEVRLDEAGGDPHVGVDPLAVQPDRDVPAEPAQVAQAALVAGVVVDDPDPVRPARRRAWPAARRRCCRGGCRWRPAARRPRRRTSPSSSSSSGRDHHLPRLRPGAVAHRDRDRLPTPDPVAQRRPGRRTRAAPPGPQPAGSGTAGGGRGVTTKVRSAGRSTVRPPHRRRAVPSLPASLPAGRTSRYTRVAVPPKTCAASAGSRSGGELLGRLDHLAGTDAASVQTGQSEPNITRSGPNAPSACSA